MNFRRCLLVGAALLALAGCQPAKRLESRRPTATPAPAELEVEQLARAPADYAGRTLRLRGVVASTATEQRMFTVIDVAEYQSCRELDCAGYEVPVAFAGALPETARVVRIAGRLEQPEKGRYVLRAERVETVP